MVHVLAILWALLVQMQWVYTVVVTVYWLSMALCLILAG